MNLFVYKPFTQLLQFHRISKYIDLTTLKILKMYFQTVVVLSLCLFLPIQGSSLMPSLTQKSLKEVHPFQLSGHTDYGKISQFISIKNINTVPYGQFERVFTATWVQL